MLGADLGKGAAEQPISAEPFINHRSQGVLITGRTWPALNLFRGHVPNRAGHIGGLVTGTLGDERNTKITQQDLVASAQ